MARWWQLKDFFIFTPNLGEMIQFDVPIFQLGWFNHQHGWRFVSKKPTINVSSLSKFRQSGEGWYSSNFRAIRELVQEILGEPRLKGRL